MSTLALSEGTRTRRLQVIADDLDAATTPGRMLLYTGTPASPPGAATTEPLQCTVTLVRPSATVSGAVLTFSTGAIGNRVRSETITWARLVDGDGNFVADGTVSVPGGGGVFEISAVAGGIGAQVSISSGVISE